MAAEKEWNGNYEVSVSRDADSWTMEARIPLSELKTKASSGKTWGVNFRRKQRLNTTVDWLVPMGYDPETSGLLTMK